MLSSMMASDNPIVLDYEPVTTRERITALKHKLPGYIRTYFVSLFPIFQWITRYKTSVSHTRGQLCECKNLINATKYAVVITGHDRRYYSWNGAGTTRHRLRKDCKP